MAGSNKINRRAFGALAAAALAAPTLAVGASPAPRMPLIKPPRLRLGDTIALVAPGGHTDEAGIALASARIERLGFKVRHSPNLRAVFGLYGGSVQQRVSDLHAMFADPQVKAIWCIRGGSGCISILNALDYALIRQNPTILIGFSDITALQLAIYRQAGLVTFHGPVATSSDSPYSNQHLLSVLMDPQPRYVIAMAEENRARALQEPQFGVRTLTQGTAEGRLLGGNLSLVSALMGTPYAADFRDAILFIEEANEAPYRIDRWMTQLDLAVGFAQAAAVMLGVCQKCVPADDEPSLSTDQTLDLHLKPLRIPAVSGYSFGHIRDQFTLPLGLPARLDTASQTLTLLEPAVS
ncbi:LD-carboxypeptidase [Massilia sp. CF038]|uniref:S66 peptidase family protein n=1 Tax=Massilia sp. CF038 TaxID=1881045 RepID=UPI00092218F6|nr:LD-carboxypeptidase [Massilia sp. CF038]SHH47205.1 muramoyltetrapeptide carboxypeptidase [Massilia sp. CF038]